MKIFYLSIALYTALQFTACKNANNNNQVKNTYPVTNPIVMDTSYQNDYIADIHSVQNVELRARVKGYLEKIHVDEGKTVKEGQVLFSISSQEYKEELLRAKAMLKSAIADAKAAEVDLANVKTLVEKNVVSKSELEMAKAKLDALNAKIEEAQAYEANANLKLSFTEIKAPFDGIIDRIPNKIGSLIDEGTLLTSISDNKDVFVYFNVSEMEYLEFITDKTDSTSRNNLILILANNKPHPHKGNIETVDGEFDQSTGSIAFRARFPNPERILKHGSSGKIRLFKKVKNALLIPQKSTFEIQDKLYVYVVDKSDTVRLRAVQPRLRIPHLFIIQSGISVDERIIYEGIQNVKEGSKVISDQKDLKQLIKSLDKQ